MYFQRVEVKFTAQFVNHVELVGRYVVDFHLIDVGQHSDY